MAQRSKNRMIGKFGKLGRMVLTLFLSVIAISLAEPLVELANSKMRSYQRAFQRKQLRWDR